MISDLHPSGNLGAWDGDRSLALYLVQYCDKEVVDGSMGTRTVGQ
jgi:hypothetical protein